MNNFEYAWPVKVYFGENTVKEKLGSELKNWGRNIMLAYGGGSIRKNGIYDEIMGVLKQADKNVVEFSGITANPTYAKVQEGIELYRKEEIDLILAVGGGSVIDCCKIITAGAYIDEDLWDSQINHKQVAEKMGCFAAVVTMSGAGAEMDCLGACSNEELKLKKTFIGSYAKFVMEDPRYVMEAPLSMFMPGVFDSLSHCMETFFGNVTNVHDEMNIGLMRNIARNMRELSAGNDTLTVRSDLMWDSSLIQMFLLNAGKPGDFQAHQMENLLGAHSHGTHGVQLGILQPVYYRHIYKYGADKFAWFARAVMDIDAEGKTKEELALAGIDALEVLIKNANLPLSFHEAGYELTLEVAKDVAENFTASPGSCRPLSKEEVVEIIMKCK